VLKEGKIYIPKDKALRIEIIWLHYDVCNDLKLELRLQLRQRLEEE